MIKIDISYEIRKLDGYNVKTSIIKKVYFIGILILTKIEHQSK